MSACECRLDFISVTNKFESIDECEVAITGVAAFVPDGDRWAYLNDRRTQFKSVAELRGIIKCTNDWYCLQIQLPGEFCKCVDQLALCQYLESNGFRCTRIDIALDDYKRRVSFDTLQAIGDLGQYRLVDSFKSIQSKIASEAEPVGTCYFGSSDKILRFYDAEFVHGIEADRWELQLRNDIARSAFSIYISEPYNLASLLVGSVDFGISGSYYRDFVRFSWWQTLIEDAGFAYLIPRQLYEPDLSRSINWLDTAVAPTLAVLRAGLGSQFNVFMTQLCNGGDNRLKPYHKKWIETIYESQIDVLKVLQECSK